MTPPRCTCAKTTSPLGEHVRLLVQTCEVHGRPKDLPHCATCRCKVKETDELATLRAEYQRLMLELDRRKPT